jgi:hypothetical protein
MTTGLASKSTAALHQLRLSYEDEDGAVHLVTASVRVTPHPTPEDVLSITIEGDLTVAREDLSPRLLARILDAATMRSLRLIDGRLAARR